MASVQFPAPLLSCDRKEAAQSGNTAIQSLSTEPVEKSWSITILPPDSAKESKTREVFKKMIASYILREKIKRIAIPIIHAIVLLALVALPGLFFVPYLCGIHYGIIALMVANVAALPLGFIALLILNVSPDIVDQLMKDTRQRLSLYTYLQRREKENDWSNMNISTNSLADIDLDFPIDTAARDDYLQKFKKEATKIERLLVSSENAKLLRNFYQELKETIKLF
jgi:hypothetical protein